MYRANTGAKIPISPQDGNRHEFPANGHARGRSATYVDVNGGVERSIDLARLVTSGARGFGVRETLEHYTVP